MGKNVKYYRVTLCNPYEENSLKQDAIVIVFDIDGRELFYESRELLTNKKVFGCDMFHNGMDKKRVLESFINQKCELMGGDFKEINEELVLKFLKFTPRIEIENIIKSIEIIRESIRNTIKNNQNVPIKR